jgi:hypothetical protein
LNNIFNTKLIRADLINEEEKRTGGGVNKFDNSRIVVLWRRGEVMPRPFGLGAGSGRQVTGVRGGGVPRRAEISYPCCPESRACPARRNNFAQVGSGHKQYTVRRGRVIPRRTSKYILYIEYILNYVRQL